MDFIVEKISEDSFYINLLIGLPQTLERLGIKEYNLERNNPVSEPAIIQWEHKQGVTLPEDLREFYSSVNGLLFEWYFSFQENIEVKDKKESTEKQIVGNVEVNSLENLKQIFGYVTTNEPGIMKKDRTWKITLSLESKVFEVCSVADGKVVLVYLFPKLEPSVWFFTCPMEFCYLSKNFKSYLKMCIAHVGIPNWQFAFTPEGISEWTKGLFRILAPHLLPESRQYHNSPRKYFKSKDNSIATTTNFNKIDPSIFKPRLSQLTALCKNETSDPNLKQNNNQENQNHEYIKKNHQLKFQRKPLYHIKKK